MHVTVEKRATGRPAVSLTDDDKVPSKRKIDLLAATVRDRRIDACAGLAKVDLLPHGFLLLQRDEALGYGKAMIEGIVHT